MTDRPDRPRYYLTTAIAYANNKPGLHTLYEVIGADVIARWHRMIGDDTRFLTGTDEHSINIAQSALDEGRAARDFVDEKVALLQGGRGGARRSAPTGSSGRPTPTTSGRPRRWSVGRTPTATSTSARTRAGTARTRASATRPTSLETARGTICPNHPDVPLQWLTERNWFFRLSAYQERLERHFAEHPDFVQPDYRRNEMLGFIRGGLEDFSISRERTPGDWGIPFPIAENGETALREDGSWDPEAGKIYVWFDALINYITGAGFPDDPDAFARWWPADLHVIGKDIARFHTIFWPAMLWSAGLEAPRQVWVHGWLLAAGGERMSKSRGNFLDPNDFVAAFGPDGARYVVAARGPVRSRRRGVSWDSFVRRYNADLANDFGNLVNRTVSMTNRYLDGERPAPRPPAGRRWPTAGRRRAARLRASALEACLLHDALADAVGSSSEAANRLVDAEKPWDAGQGREGRRRRRGRRAARRPGRPRSRPAGWSAWPPRRSCPAPRRACSPSSATRYPYGADGNGGPPILDELRLGRARGGGRPRCRAGAALPAARPDPRLSNPPIRFVVRVGAYPARPAAGGSRHGEGRDHPHRVPGRRRRTRQAVLRRGGRLGVRRDGRHARTTGCSGPARRRAAAIGKRGDSVGQGLRRVHQRRAARGGRRRGRGQRRLGDHAAERWSRARVATPRSATRRAARSASGRRRPPA